MKKLILSGMLLLSVSAFSKAESVQLYKDANCGCGQLWGEAINKAGYDVVINEISYDELS
ncbi:metal-binding protein, partial [Providencia rettgeri]|nr:metal-binding protein [Providencia rettgeri]